MKKFWIQVTVLVLAVFGSLYVFYNDEILGGIIPIGLEQGTQTSIKINNTVIKTEVADTQSKRSKGLGGREGLASDSGMIFIFPEDKKYQFWMKGVKFGLDFVFIRDGKVVDVLRNIDPPTPGQKDSTLPIYEPVVPIDMALEVNKGFVDSHKINIGDTVFLMK